MRTEKQKDNQKEQSASSRVFKLRAWDIERKVMQYGDSISMDLDGYIWRGGVDRTNRYTIMQYTGLKDKNGEEVYEDDIVERSGSSIKTRGEIYFNKELLQYRMRYRNDNGNTFHCELDERYLTVFGNIYENPGLLIDSDYHLS